MPCARRLPTPLLVLLLVGCGGAPLGPDAPALPAPAAMPDTPTAPTPEPASPPTPEELGTSAVDLAPEVSGIVAGRRDPALLWLVDDGPDTTSVVAVSQDGTLVTRVEMEGVDGRDVEDIAAGPCGTDDPTPCLYVGDIGDNRGVRDAIRIHRFPEPAGDAIVTPAETATYTLPGGAVDAEALVVTAEGLPVVLTKEEGVARLLAATAFAGAPLSGIADWPAVELPVAFEGQGEAIAYLPDGHSHVTASEGSGILSVVRR